MKRRLPVDIEFLMESIMSETPDKVYDNNGDQIVSWFHDYNYTFFLLDDCWMYTDSKDDTDNVESRNTHMDFVTRIAQAIRRHPRNVMAALRKHHIFVESPEKFKASLKNGTIAQMLHDYRGQRDSRGEIMDSFYDDVREKYGLTGRVWPQKKLVSFWNEPEDVKSQWDKVEKFFDTQKSILGNLEKYLVDYGVRNRWQAQSMPLDSAKTISSTKGSVGDVVGKILSNPEYLSKLDDKKVRAVRGKLHTMPAKEKNKALQAMGASNVKAAEIAEKLGMTVAEFNHLMQVNENVLAESPDGVYGEDHKRIAGWFEHDAFAFFAFKHFSMLGRGVTHGRMGHHFRVMAGSDFPDESYEPDDMMPSSMEDFQKEINNPKSELAKYVKRDPEYHGNYRRVGVVGRLWTEKKIISFWRENEDVVAHWEWVKKMFEVPEFKRILGDLNDYRVDFLERSNNPDLPLVSASSIGSNTMGQSAPIDRLSDKQINQLQLKLHTMTPDNKAKVLKALGASNDKASSIARKLGMSVAEFNHIMQVNEEMLTEDPDTVKVTGDGEGESERVDERSPDAVAFFVVKDTYAFSLRRGMYHWHILRAIYLHMRGVRITPEAELVFGDLPALEKYMSQNLKWYKLLKAVATGDSLSDNYRTAFGLSGRIWRNKKIISLWNEVSEIKQQLPELKKMFAENENIFGSINDYRFDYITRKPWQALLSVEELEKLDLDNTNDADIKKLQQVMHVASPEKKRDILNMLGAKVDKSGEIADKLGMTKAQLNYIANVNEIKLTELLKRILEGK